MSSKQNDDTAEPTLDRQRSVMIDGAMYPAAQAAEICRRRGLCVNCAETRTHKKKGFGLMHRMEPITDMDANGNYTVYKGYCIKPLCYSLDQAKRELGEHVDRPSIMRGPRSKRKEKKHSNRRAAQDSTPSAAAFHTTEEDRSGGSNDNSYGSDYSPHVSSVEKHDSSKEDINFNPYTRRNSASHSSDYYQEKGSFKSMDHRRASSSEEFRFIPESQVSRSNLSDGNMDRNGSDFQSYQNLEGYSPSIHRKSKSDGFSPSFHGKSYSEGFSPSFHGKSYSEGFSPSSISQQRNSSGSMGSDSGGSSRRNLSRPSMDSAPMAPNLDEIDEEKVAINELERLAHEQRYRDLMETLCSNYGLPNVILKAFQLLRDTVHVANQTCGYVFSSPTPWVKYIVAAMERNSKNQVIQSHGVWTLWTLAAVGPKYMKEIAKSSGVDAVLSTLDKYKSDEEIVETCCGALECLTSNKKEGISMKHSAAKKIVKSLVEIISLDDDVVHREDNFDVVREDSGCAKTLALRALYNLSVQGNESLTDTVKDALPDGNGLAAILSVVKKGGDNVDPVEWAVRLLWSLSYSTPLPIPQSILIETIVGALDKFESPAFQESACGLLSDLTITASDTSSVSAEMSQKIAGSIVVSATSHLSVKSIQLSCINVLSGICSSPDKLAIVAEMDIVRLAIDAMRTYPEDADVQGSACMLLAYLCANETTKAAIATVDGVNAIITAFSTYVVDHDMTSDSSEFVESIKQGASIALASLAMNPHTANMLAHSGILVDLDQSLRNENNSAMPASLRAVVINMLAAKAQVAEVGAETDYTTVTLAMEALKSSESVDEAETLMTAIHSTTCTSPHTFDYILSVNNGGGMEILLKSIESFPASEIVQVSGCAILANLYVKIPYNGALNQRTRLTIGSRAFDVETHAGREVKLLLSAMNKHKNKARIQEYACSALCNFVVGSYSDVVPSDVEKPEEVVAAFSGAVKKIIDAFSIHQDSLEVQRSACRLLWVMAYFNDEMEMKRWSLHGIAKIFEAMARFKQDEELNLIACGTLLAMIEDENNAQFMGNNDGVRAMIRGIRFRNEEIVEQASMLLDLIMQRVYPASNEFMLIEDSIESVILCMDENAQSASIQKSLCSMLASLVSLQDSFVKGLIGNNGGLVAIEAAIRNHREDEMVVECGCRALSGIVGGCMPELLRHERLQLGEILMSSLTDHPTNAVVQNAVLGALWGLCAREESFSDYIAATNGLPIVIDTMNQHLTEEQVIASGCSLLWMMSTYGDNKRMIGRVGIRAVINGMLAHITSSAVQKEALTALKNLATDQENKRATTELGGVQAIVQSMWVHMVSPQIYCAACSALNNIAVDSVSRRVAPIEHGELMPICFGMRKHAHDIEVQKCACFLLKSYTFAPSNIPLMRSEVHLAGLLTSAAERFPSECEERASFVLRHI